MSTFLTSNEWNWRLARTIVQGILGVVVANIDVLVGTCVLDPAARAICVALRMAVLSPAWPRSASTWTGATWTCRRAVRQMRLNEIAAEIHRRMCEDDRFGYSWEERYGATWETWSIGGRDYRIKVGDYDCSSSTITAWSVALQGTPWEGALDGATYTGNMSDVFCGSGLFERMPMSFLAEPGDLYLDDSNHVAMCQSQYPDVLSEFSWGDNGAYGNVRGDQSGWEASVHGYYDYPWQCILHFVGGEADYGDNSFEAPSGSGGSSGQPVMPRYRVAIMEDGEKTWLPFMRGMVDEGGSDDTYAGEPGCGIVDVEFDIATLGPQGWFEKNMSGGKLIGLTVYYDTEDPASMGWWYCKYRVHWLGSHPAWGKWEIDDEDGGAGNDVDQIDMIELTIIRC